MNLSGDCEDFEPEHSANFRQTSAPPGSAEKIEELRNRAESGEPFWHRDDRTDFAGCRSITPRQLPQ
jgi:hypothetical protein